MSLAVDGIWKSGVWATSVWASGVWYEGATVRAPHPGLPKRVRTKKRHRKLDTFRQELEHLVYGTKRAIAETPLEAAIAVEQTINLIERYNYLQALENSLAVQNQLDSMMSDMAKTNGLLTQIQENRVIAAQNEEVILMMVAGDI